MKKNPELSRREFIRKNAITGAGTVLGVGMAGKLTFARNTGIGVPAVLGGESMVKAHDWPEWPIWNSETDEKRLLEVMRSGVWSRAGVVNEFEQRWAELMGSKRCLAVVNGTNALNASLAQLEIGWGDEVIVTPYTFIASVSCIIFNGAIPVFVDVDPETFQMDPDKVEERITSRTRAILPVHILGLPSDMNRIMAIARKHNLIVVEDACQSWHAEINGKKTGTFGRAGCFSFQNSKNLPVGECGAIISDDEDFMDRCYSYHNYGNPYGSVVGSVGTGTLIPGTKLRITEYQAAIALAQMERLEEQTLLRNRNAASLREKIATINGIIPYRLYEGVTKAAFHLFPFRYHQENFEGLTRSAFLKALRAEGVPCSDGYRELNRMPFIRNAFENKYFKKFYPSELIDYESYMEQNQCPLNQKLCNEEAVWIPQNVLLGSENDMKNIAAAIEKIRNNAREIRDRG